LSVAIKYQDSRSLIYNALKVGGGYYIKVPLLPTLCIEYLLERLPNRWQKKLAQFRPLMAFINVRLLAIK
jgi:hypothetical protein